MPEQDSEEKFLYDLSSICGYFILVNAAVLVIALFVDGSVQAKVYIQLLLSVGYVGFLFINGIPFSISINPTRRVLSIRSFERFKIQNRAYDCGQLLCTYKDEVGARGSGKSKVFRLTDKSGRTILKIMPNFNGWSNEKLRTISERLAETQRQSELPST